MQAATGINIISKKNNNNITPGFTADFQQNRAEVQSPKCTQALTFQSASVAQYWSAKFTCMQVHMLRLCPTCLL